MSKSENVVPQRVGKQFLVHGVSTITPFKTKEGKEVDYDALVLHIMQDAKDFGQKTEELRIVDSAREIGVFRSVNFPCVVTVYFSDRLYNGKIQSLATDFELV
jgi:hypothetical protein